MRRMATHVALGCGLALAPMLAHASDPLVDGARLCTQRFPVEEANKGIPAHLLAAISSTESGRWHDRLGLALPWPWTANVEGKGYYFESKAEAVRQTTNFLRQGKRSIDVGCMQVNLKHHPKAFRNLEEAFEPTTNVAYAAGFLRTNYDSLGDWIKATAAYHSRTDVYGRQYLVRIEKAWNRIVSKVAAARARQGMNVAVTANPGFEPHRAISTSKPMNALDSTRNVRVIQVTERPQPSKDVLVIRQEPTAPVKVADAADSMAPVEAVVVQPTSDTIQRVRIDSDVPSANGGAKAASGPKFVFAN